MSEWTKETALRQLTRFITQIDSLLDQRRYSADHTRWTAGVLALLEEVFGRDSRYYLTFASYPWQETGSFIVTGHDPTSGIESRHQQAYRTHLESARGLLQSAADDLGRKDLDSVYQGKDTGPESSALLKVMNIGERKLRKTLRKAPSNEQEIQDRFEDLLMASDIPYSREKEAIEYSSKTYVPDFTVPRIDLAIDIKLCASRSREKEIIAEINDDILAYSTKYGNLFFLVYDLGFIRDIDVFRASFEEYENVVIRVVKH